jgi:hypothetical protein
VEADARRIRDVERIAANPALFDSVRMRIAVQKAGPTVHETIFRRPIAAFAGLMMIGGFAFAFVTLRREPAIVVHRPAVMPVKTVDVTKFPESDRVETSLPRRDEPMRVERVSTKPSSRSFRPKQPSAPQIQHEGDFYALSYAGDPNETERGGRIVRVDLPRSALFAMGVDIPLENETETVKADLLVGNDGVTRAIRVVR